MSYIMILYLFVPCYVASVWPTYQDVRAAQSYDLYGNAHGRAMLYNTTPMASQLWSWCWPTSMTPHGDNRDRWVNVWYYIPWRRVASWLSDARHQHVRAAQPYDQYGNEHRRPHDGLLDHIHSELIPGLRLANERRRYKVTPSLIGWAQT